MHPDDRELDEETRGHLALSVTERVDRGGIRRRLGWTR